MRARTARGSGNPIRRFRSANDDQRSLLAAGAAPAVKAAGSGRRTALGAAIPRADIMAVDDGRPADAAIGPHPAQGAGLTPRGRAARGVGRHVGLARLRGSRRATATEERGGQEERAHLHAFDVSHLVGFSGVPVRCRAVDPIHVQRCVNQGGRSAFQITAPVIAQPIRPTTIAATAVPSRPVASSFVARSDQPHDPERHGHRAEKRNKATEHCEAERHPRDGVAGPGTPR